MHTSIAGVSGAGSIRGNDGHSFMKRAARRVIPAFRTRRATAARPGCPLPANGPQL
jgi:hypothetical protein